MKPVDFCVAVGAGLAVAIPMYMIFTLPDYCGSRPPLTQGQGLTLLFSLASYLIAALLCGLPGRPWLTRFMWLWTSVVGSLLTAVALHSLATPSRDWEVSQFAILWLILCGWTLPFAAIVNYSAVVFRWIRRSHQAPNENLSTSSR